MTNQWHGISREYFEEKAIGQMIAFAKGGNLPEGYVPEYEIFLRVNKDNPVSSKVMIHNGGYVDREDEFKYYVRIKK